MSPGLDREIQRDFAAGIWRGLRPEVTPPAAVFDVVNGLYSDDGAIFKRGGSSYFSDTALGARLTMVWDGLLNTAARTLISNDTDTARVASDGTVTTIAGLGGLTRPGRIAVMNGVAYLPGGKTYDGTTVGAAAKLAPFYAVVANRLIAAGGRRIDFSDVNTPGTFGATSFYELPEGVEIVGVEPLRDAAAIFTTGGVWIYSGLALNLTDPDGNVQHSIDQYSRELVLWGDAGIAGWEGALVVPGIDAVWLMARGVTSEADQAFQRISDPIAVLYKDYVARGYRPGRAGVIRGNYVLPIVDATNEVMDALVCRLDLPGRPWSRLDGFGADVTAVAVQTEAGEVPKLLGASMAGRLLELAFFEPTAATKRDADESVPVFEVTSRDVPTGRLAENTVVRMLLGYELADADADNPTIQAWYMAGRPLPGSTEWGLFDWGEAEWSDAANAVLLAGEAPEDTFGVAPFSWQVGRRERFARFRFRCDDPVARLVIRSLELQIRPTGRP